MSHEPDAEKTRDCQSLRPVDGHNDAPFRSSRRWWRSSGFVSVRDVILFGAGLGIIGWEIAGGDPVDPVVLLVGAAAAGLPLIFDPRRP